MENDIVIFDQSDSVTQRKEQGQREIEARVEAESAPAKIHINSAEATAFLNPATSEVAHFLGESTPSGISQ